MRSGLAVRLRLPPDLDPAADSVQISVRLSPAEVDARVARPESTLGTFLAETRELVFDARGEVALTLHAPGRYRVQWRVLRRDGRQQRQRDQSQDT